MGAHAVAACLSMLVNNGTTPLYSTRLKSGHVYRAYIGPFRRAVPNMAGCAEKCRDEVTLQRSFIPGSFPWADAVEKAHFLPRAPFHLVSQAQMAHEAAGRLGVLA